MQEIPSAAMVKVHPPPAADFRERSAHSHSTCSSDAHLWETRAKVNPKGDAPRFHGDSLELAFRLDQKAPPKARFRQNHRI
jgi:hypothetical protein